jgi:hypothetical protein
MMNRPTGNDTPDTTPANQNGRRSPYDLPLDGWLVNTLAEGWDPAPAVRHPAVPTRPLVRWVLVRRL